MKLKEILKKHRSNLALVIGNGINKYRTSTKTNSWSELLIALSNKFLTTAHENVPAGISLTEFYDLLDLQSIQNVPEKSLQEEFCSLMRSWRPYEHHKRIVSWASAHNIPLLTTNFDNVLGVAGDCELMRTKEGGFTDFYPWENYYGHNFINDPTAAFGIWHINGMKYYRRSIRLGLTHYMGSVSRARGWLHKGDERGLFSGKDQRNWIGANTWLHIIFNKPLLIIGLGLEENEVFLRWLLIERARYFKKFADRSKPAWYVHVSEYENSGKLFFLRGVRIEPVKAKSYDEIYGPNAWE